MDEKMREGFSLLRITLKRGQVFLLGITVLTLSSCLLESQQSGAGRADGARSGINNTQNSVNVGFGRILEDNPIILSQNPDLRFDVNLSTLLTSRQEYITDKEFLEGECFSFSGTCFEVRKDETSDKLQSPSRKWAYQTGTTEFLQVNTFGHLKRVIERYQSSVQDIFFNRTGQGAGPGLLKYRTAIPSDLLTEEAHWRSNLLTFADSGIQDNAFYSPASFQIGLGEDSVYPELKFGHDSTVIYHEAGHAFNEIMINMRNRTGASTALGQLFYDEGGAINEGIADYYSYVMNQRTHFGEWALGRYINQSRPLKESDPLHAPGIEVNSQGRLSYPTYLNYDPNAPEEVVEDIHYSGQILSHFLVALTEKIKSTCSLNHKKATSIVLHLLTETLAEMGDLSAKGGDHNGSDQVNLNDNVTPNMDGLNSQEWARIALPLNYRNFSQTMGRYLVDIYGNSSENRCNGTYIEQDDIEKLFDDYGLLLFRTYNNNKNSIPGVSNKNVSVANRVKSSLVNKSALKIDPRSGNPKAFVFDDRASMINALAQLGSSGQLKDTISSQIESDLPYNNGNSQISPGEFLGIALNLYNDSNSPIAGVEVLANDWDHSNQGQLCNNLGDNFPSESEGGVSDGDCETVTQDNGNDGDEISPVCYVETIDGSSSQWVSQKEFLKDISGMTDSQCLAGPERTDNCFIRFPRGADRAAYSKIDPKKTFGQTIVNESGDPSFNFANLLFMEVNKSIPPGTNFRCRLRGRFTNCDDCYHDSDNSNDDYRDFEYAGHRPFKILNFEFTVID